MSHFTEMEVQFQQKNEKQLIEALEKVFGKGSVEVHEKGGALIGYEGNDRSKLNHNNANYAPLCHLIIRKNRVGSASNDVGYRRMENGKYIAYISEYDQRTNFSEDKQNELKKQYSYLVTQKELKRMGYEIKTTKKQNGTIVLEAERWTKD